MPPLLPQKQERKLAELKSTYSRKANTLPTHTPIQKASLDLKNQKQMLFMIFKLKPIN